MRSMPKTHSIDPQDAEKIKQLRKQIRDKQEDKRLYAVQLRAEGTPHRDIATKLDTSRQVISNWISKYVKEGLEGLLKKGQKGNHRNLSFEEEAQLLQSFEEEAKKGQLICIREIEEAYRDKVGHSISNAQIYRVLKRHNRRKVMPRSKHPKKASEEAIEASKKLTHRQKS